MSGGKVGHRPPRPPTLNSQAYSFSHSMVLASCSTVSIYFFIFGIKDEFFFFLTEHAISQNTQTN